MGDDVKASAWTIFEAKEQTREGLPAGSYGFVFCYFSILNDDIWDRGPDGAARVLDGYMKERELVPITDFDEMYPKFEATYPIMRHNFDENKVRQILQKVSRSVARQ